MLKSRLPRCTTLHGAQGFKYKSPESTQQCAAMCQFPLTVFTSLPKEFKRNNYPDKCRSLMELCRCYIPEWRKSA